ncbi:MAG: RcnB family protein [Rhodoferax sp.]
MRTLKTITTVVSLTLLAGSLAIAQDRRGEREDSPYQDRGRNQGRGPQDHGNQGRGPQDRQQPARQNDDRRHDDRRNDMREQRGAGPEHQFQRGGRLPAQYRQQIYVVNNWHTHQLPPPPRGHHWVQVGADYVLVAIATGVIVQLILDNAY